jgi:hypothetical protein
MDEQQAREEIKLIRDMLERTRRATAESGALFIFWGIWLVLGLAGHHVLCLLLHRYEWIWWNWAFFGLGGWIVSAVYSIRRGRKSRTRTYAQSATAFVSFGCSIAFLLAAFVFPLLRIYPYDAIPVIIALISGIMVFAMGGIFRWPLLWAAGLLWWAGAVVMAFVPVDWRASVLIPLIILGYVVPGLLFRARFRRNGVDRAAE